MARQGLALAGGVIGAYFGGAIGAQVGFAAGSIVGGYIDPEKIRGPKLGDAPMQTGRPGVPIPIGWGIWHTAGNVIWRNAIVEVEEEERQGKGGGTVVVNVRRYRTFAIGVGRSIDGPIAAYRRIWENDKLVYDRTETPAIPVADTDAYEAFLTLYYGTLDQLPDPEREAEVGVGLTPGYRGLAYVVWNNYDITDFGSAIPQYRFEVQSEADFSFTSRPYPVQDIAGLDMAMSQPVDRIVTIPQEGFDMAMILITGSIGLKLKSYTGPPEGLDMDFDIVTGAVATKVKYAPNQKPEGLDMDFTLVDAEIPVKVVYWTHWPTVIPEGLDMDLTLISGSIET